MPAASSQRHDRLDAIHVLVAGIVAVEILLLPLLMGHRTPDTLALSGMILVAGAMMAALSAWSLSAGAIPPPDRGWLLFGGILTALVIVQVWPSTQLAQWFGYYPDALWNHPDFRPRHWSPNPHATLRAWATFAGLFTLAWMLSVMPHRGRAVVWLAVLGMAWFQAVYGLMAHAADSESIFGIWQRHTPEHAHGSFSNRNLYAAWLVLAWPMSMAVWMMPGVPWLSRLPRELAITGAILSGMVVGTAILASASRLGAAGAFVTSIVALALWIRLRDVARGVAVWPLYLAVICMLLGAVWYGLSPLTGRLLGSGYGSRLEIWWHMLADLPARLYVTGVGLGGFEAVFKLVQPAGIHGWVDYAHNDLLQWILETGVIGIVLLVWLLVTLVRNARLSMERTAIYAGLAGLCVIGLADFSWHIPATQVVLAAYLGTALRGRDRKVSRYRDTG